MELIAGLEATTPPEPIPDRILAIADPARREETIRRFRVADRKRRLAVHGEVAKAADVPPEVLAIKDTLLRQKAKDAWNAASQLRCLCDQWFSWFQTLKYHGFMAHGGLAFRIWEAGRTCIRSLCRLDVDSPSFHPGGEASVLDRLPSPPDGSIFPYPPWWDKSDYFWENYNKLVLDDLTRFQSELWSLMESIKAAPSTAFRSAAASGGHQPRAVVTSFLDSTSAIREGVEFNTTPDVDAKKIEAKDARSTRVILKEKRGAKRARIKEYFSLIANQNIDSLNAGNEITPFDTRANIARDLKVDEGTVSNVWKEFSGTTLGKVAVRLKLTCRWGGKYSKEAEIRMPRGHKSKDGRIEAYDRSRHEDDE